MAEERTYVSRGGAKLRHAVDCLRLDLREAVAADFGCSVGGFTDCLLQEGAARVYAVDAARGALAWKLRQDPRVVVMERTNAMHVQLPEPVDVVAIDVGWTAQRRILPNALRQVKPDGIILSLFKPQYEAPRRLVRGGHVVPGGFEVLLGQVTAELGESGIRVHEVVRLPPGGGGRNPEAFLCIRRGDCRPIGTSAHGPGECC